MKRRPQPDNLDNLADDDFLLCYHFNLITLVVTD